MTLRNPRKTYFFVKFIKFGVRKHRYADGSRRLTGVLYIISVYKKVKKSIFSNFSLIFHLIFQKKNMKNHEFSKIFFTIGINSSSWIGITKKKLKKKLTILVDLRLNTLVRMCFSKIFLGPFLKWPKKWLTVENIVKTATEVKKAFCLFAWILRLVLGKFLT